MVTGEVETYVAGVNVNKNCLIVRLWYTVHKYCLLIQITQRDTEHQSY
jgi:hypothetical protein